MNICSNRGKRKEAGFPQFRDQILVSSECRARMPPTSTFFGVSGRMVGLAELPGRPGAVQRVIRCRLRLPYVAASAARA